ncbi:hypothetical protein [Agaribacter flavus]|uniref:hypothetical protein n=1 Tax=Agaribacter flavus TaxID=1902781 RepID=UPI00367040B0
MLILSIVLVGSSIFEHIRALKNDIDSAVAMHVRLNAVKNSELSAELLELYENYQTQVLSNIPTASSQSAAEASALSKLEASFNTILERNRFNLLGSEKIETPSSNLWSVRVEINGRLSESNVLRFLENVEPTAQNIRVASMQYSPKASNSVIIVIDLLFKEQLAK